MIHSWPPYEEGHEQLSPELFTDYGPPHGPAHVDWAEGQRRHAGRPPAFRMPRAQHRGEQADLLRLWPGALRPAKARRPSIARLVKQAERASGHSVSGITTPDGMTIHFGQPELGEANNPWLADLKVTKQ